MSFIEQLRRLERLKRSMLQRQDIRVHATIDGQDTYLPFYDAYQIALSEDYATAHAVAFHDFEERGCGLLSALLACHVGIDLNEHDDI